MAVGDESSHSQPDMQREQRERLWTPLLAFILVGTLCSFIVCQGYNAGTTVYLSYQGIGTEVSGILMIVYCTSAAVTRLVCGPILDTRGRYIVAIAGSIVLMLSTSIPLLFPGLAPLFVCRLLQGVGFSSATTATSTMVADIAPSSRLGEAIGYSGLSQALAMTVGPALCMVLLESSNPDNFFIGLLIISGTALLLILPCRYERHPETLPPTSACRVKYESAQRKAADAESANTSTATNEVSQNSGLLSRVFEMRALPGVLPSLAMSAVYGFAIVYAALYGTQIGVGNAGLFYSVAAISMIATRLLSGKFMDVAAPIKILAVATAGGVISMALLFGSSLCVGTIAASGLFYVAGLFYGLCNGLCVPVNIAVAVKCTPPERWGAATAFAILANDIGYGLGSALFGFTVPALGYQVTFVLVALCALIAFALGKRLYPRK